MTDPVLRLMEKALIKKGKRHLTGYVPNYFCLRLALGLVNPTRIDDIWDPDAAAYNPRLSQLLSRRKLWELQRYVRPNVVKLVAKCSQHWAAAWIMGAFVAGDEAIAPHKGKGPMRMYIPRKNPCDGGKAVRLGRRHTLLVVQIVRTAFPTYSRTAQTRCVRGLRALHP